MKASRKSGTGLLAAAGVLFLLGGVGICAHFVNAGDAKFSPMSSPMPSKTAGISAISNEEPAAVPEPVSGDSLVIHFNGHVASFARTDLSDRKAIVEELRAVASDWDRGPVDAFLDLEGREVVGAVDGNSLDVLRSASAVELALRQGEREVLLLGVAVPASVTVEDLGVSDISAVVGTFSTKFSVADKTRNANLKLLASKINGRVIKPGEKFSFNEATGMRVLEDGFKIAHVISQGEMVDGMAGGSCQISTTLHGAAFFSGLDIPTITPHSRPSTYVPIALDATVVAGKVDLEIVNPYEFPVVVHFSVARGVSKVEILGREKPFDHIEFQRNIYERIQFQTVTREDDTMGLSYSEVDQMGYPGYKVHRQRRTFKDGKVIKTDSWKLAYLPVVEYLRVGINPDPNLPAPKAKRPHRGPKPGVGRFTITQ